MRKQDHLLKLIASLTPNEKRYFKLLCNMQDGEKRYLKLFDVLDSKEKYDAAFLTQKLKLTPQQLADDKKHLTRMLFRSLRNVDELKPSVTSYNDLINAQILIDKRLFAHAVEVIDKGLMHAREQQLVGVIIPLLRLKQSCLAYIDRCDELEAIADEMNSTEQAASELFEMERMHEAAYDIFIHSRDVEAYKKLLRHPLMKKGADQQKTLKAAIFWYNIVIWGSSMEDNWTKALETIRLKVKHLEADSRFRKIHPENVVSAYEQLANAEIQCDNYLNGLAGIEKLTQLFSDPNLNVTNYTRESYSSQIKYLKIRALRYLHRFDEAYELVKGGDAKDDIPVKSFFWEFEHALALLHTNRSVLANNKLNELLQMQSDVGLDVQAFLRPVQILVQLDLGNYTLVPFIIKSAKAWNKKNKISFSKELDLFFSHTRAIANVRQTPERKKAWVSLYNALETKDFDMVHEVHLKQWMESKKLHV